MRNTRASTKPDIATSIDHPLFANCVFCKPASLLRQWPGCATEKRMTPSDYPAGYPPRSLLYVPGSNARALEKAGGLAADMLIIDLEDAVPEGRKAEAREAVHAAVTAGFPGKRVAVRVKIGRASCRERGGAYGWI